MYKDITNYEKLYEINELGQVCSKDKTATYKGQSYLKGRELKQEVTKSNKTNYRRVTLSKDGKTKRFLVHRLVAEHFIPNPTNKPFINHIDNNGENNEVSNLEWCTHSENMIHAYKQGHLDAQLEETHRLAKDAKDKATYIKMETLLSTRLISIEYETTPSRSRKYVYYVCGNCNNITKARIDSILLKKNGICNSCARKQ
jgi:hypothetical protein